MKTIELPERLPRVQSCYHPNNKGDVSNLLNKIWEHEKNYFKKD